MLARLLRTVALLAALVVVVSWGAFVAGEARSASGATQAEIQGLTAARTADPSPEQERARERAHSAPRELVDDADDVLLASFGGLADGSGSRWVRRTVPALLALLLYGLGLFVLARFLDVR